MPRSVMHTCRADKGLRAYMRERMPRTSRITMQSREQFANNRKVPPPPPLDRSWIFAFDVTREQPAPIAAGADV